MYVDLKIDKSSKYPGYSEFSGRKCLIVLNSLSFESLKHEIIHIKQYINNKFHYIRYMLNDKYRLKAELEAYSEKIENLTLDEIENFAKMLRQQYMLSIDLIDINLEIFKFRDTLKRKNNNLGISINIKEII